MKRTAVIPWAVSQINREVVDGTITSAGFPTGHRVVVGRWPVSPIGPLYDVMLATPHDERILLAESEDAADYIQSIYDFDTVRIGPLTVRGDRRSTAVSGHGLELRVFGGRPRPIPFRRPLVVTRHIEAPIARVVMGVETFGTSPTGVREWYQARSWSWVERGEAALDGRDLGRPGPVDRPLGVGFSEPPRRPSIVAVRVTIEREAARGRATDVWATTSGG